ncbi:MAG: DUF421 domain-containing protein [Chloroflexota bacterium]
MDLAQTALRASLLYAFLLFVVRLLGKREVGNITPIDLIVAFMLGEVTDEIVYGDVDLAQGFTAIVAVAFWHFANSWASYRSQFIDRLTSDSATVLVEHGQVRQEALAAERMNEAELWSQLRIQGVDDLAEVKAATLEPSGHVSVLLEDWAKPLQKSDLRPQSDGHPSA